MSLSTITAASNLHSPATSEIDHSWDRQLRRLDLEVSLLGYPISILILSFIAQGNHYLLHYLLSTKCYRVINQFECMSASVQESFSPTLNELLNWLETETSITCSQLIQLCSVTFQDQTCEDSGLRLRKPILCTNLHEWVPSKATLHCLSAPQSASFVDHHSWLDGFWLKLLWLHKSESYYFLRKTNRSGEDKRSWD